jgi:MFS family permease
MSGSSVFRNRWWIVFAAFLGLTVSQGPIVAYSFSVFLKPVTQDLGISRGTFSFAYNLDNFMCAVSIPIFGLLIDRYGIRRVLLPGIALFALATAGLSYVQSSLAVLYGLFALQGVFSAANTPTAYAKAVSARFDYDRGLALGIAVAGTGFGVFLTPPVMTWLIDHYGWRDAYIGLGVTLLVFALVPVALLIHDRPPSMFPEREKPAGAAAGMSMGEAFVSAQFWTMTVAFFLIIVAVIGTISHMIAMLTDRGIPRDTATAALSAVGIAIIVSRTGAGYLVDRIFAPYVGVVFFCCPIAGIALLLSGASGVVPLVGAVLCGFGVGAEVDLMPFFIGRYCGLRAFGAIYGLMFGIFIAGAGMGGWLMGLYFDYYHSYTGMLIGFIGALAVACLLILRLGPYRFPATQTAAEESPAAATA